MIYKIYSTYYNAHRSVRQNIRPFRCGIFDTEHATAKSGAVICYVLLAQLPGCILSQILTYENKKSKQIIWVRFLHRDDYIPWGEM